MSESAHSKAAADLAKEAAGDLAELEFAPIEPEEAAELDDRVYLLGVRREYQNIR